MVNRFGGLAPGFAFGGADVQRNLLTAEGVSFSDEYTVALDKHLWNPFG